MHTRALFLLVILSGALSYGCSAPHALVRRDGFVMADPRDDCVYCLAPPHDRLCIGNEHSARNGARLREAGVGLVVSAIGETGTRHEGIDYFVLDLQDVSEQPVSRAIREAHAAISAFLSGGSRKALVHCAAGISRSSTLLAAHLVLAHREMSVAAALDVIRAARPVAQPNPGFLRALYELERSRGGPDSGIDLLQGEIH